MIINIVFMNQQELTGLNSSNVEDGGEDDDDDDDDDGDDDDDDDEEELGLSALQGGDIEVYAYTIVWYKKLIHSYSYKQLFWVHTPGFGLCKITMTNQHMGPFFECLAPYDQFSSLLLSSKPFVICLCCICAPLVYLCVDCIIHRDTASL